MRWRSGYTYVVSALLMAGLLGCSMALQPVQNDGPSLVAPREALTLEGSKDEFSRSIEDARWRLTTSEENVEKVHPRLITNEKRWAEVWSQLEGTPALPIVDFKRVFLYVIWSDAQDPNQQSLDFSINRDGVFSVVCFSTLLGFTPSAERTVYVFEIPRSGITAYREAPSRNGYSTIYRIATQQDH